MSLPTSERIFGLDVMRAVAILLVVYMHGALVLPDSLLPFYNAPVPAIDGVAVFFALSGFLIGTILLRDLERPRFGPAEILHFWIRRWFRTLPAYWLVLLMILAFMAVLGQSFDFFTWKFFIFSQNLVTKPPRFFPEAWSLAVEEWFYLSLPLLVGLVGWVLKRRKAAVLLVALALLVAPVVLRVLWFNPSEGDNRYVMFFTKIVVLRMDAIMYGVVMAYMMRYHRALCLRWRKAGLALGLLMVVAFTAEMRLGSNGDWYRAIVMPTLEPLAAMLTLPFLATWASTPYRWLQRPVEFISNTSYSIYLINLTLVQRLILPALTGEISWKVQPTVGMGLLRLVLFFVITLVLAWVLHRFWEQPMRDLRERFRVPVSG